MPTSISRAAGIAITKGLSKDLAKDNILVSTVCIGLVKSGQHGRRFDARKQSEPSLTEDAFYDQLATARSVPLGRVAEAEEAGDVIAFLASERASYLTGIAVNIDNIALSKSYDCFFVVIPLSFNDTFFCVTTYFLP